jgi:hypothetical protein
MRSRSVSWVDCARMVVKVSIIATNHVALFVIPFAFIVLIFLDRFGSYFLANIQINP